MGVYLKKFETMSQYNAYTANTVNFIKPNVSLTVDNNAVHYNPYVLETMVVAKFNVTDTSNPTQIISQDAGSPFSEIEIDGVVQPSVVSAYTFNTGGEHTVKYTLTDSTTIGDYAFYGCRSLTSIVIPSGVTSIGNRTFYNCTSLTSCTIPSGVTSIGDYDFYGCSGLTSIDIPNSVTSIGYAAFQSCSSLTSINIPSGVASIGENVFYGCSGLTSIDIPNSVTSIGNWTFYDCNSLTSINIPSGVTSIGGGAFSNCSGLTSIVCNATTAPTIQSTTFQYIKTSGTLTVPSGSSGYDVWMGTSNYYLGKYGWSKVEQ